MGLYIEGIGILALVLYFASSLFLKKHIGAFRAIASLLFGFVFMNYGAYAPMVIFFASALSSLVPVNIYLQFGQKHPTLRLLLWNVLPSVLAIVAAFVGRKPEDNILLLILPVVAVSLNLLVAILNLRAKHFPASSFIRSAIWIVYFVLVGIYVSVIYEVVNLLFYSLVLMYERKRKASAHAGVATDDGGTNASDDATAPAESDSNNTFKIPSFLETFKGQW
ncbi:MAG: hypothetical protein IKC72_04185 [Clostridia bacterium]|nr:hypothetical protein [Clostridia bacterium]